ncbi:MAG: class I SAM-dependent methyltransferase, partial [Promethearchaeota archaeon]
KLIPGGIWIVAGEKPTSDWTKELFEESPYLYLDTLKERISQASREVDVLLMRLKEQGFRAENILDLNCGIGRHSVELGKRDISVLGTDLSPYYIEIAKKQAKKEKVSGKVRFRVADMREIAQVLSGEELFDGIINLFTSFGYYDDATNEDILRQCSELVRPGGFFFLEVINRDWVIANFQERGFSWFRDMVVLEDSRFDPNTSRMHDIWTFLMRKDDTRFALEKQITIDHRIWSLHELIETFNKTGWQFKAVCPGFHEKKSEIPLLESRNLLFIGKKQEMTQKLG